MTALQRTLAGLAVGIVVGGLVAVAAAQEPAIRIRTPADSDWVSGPIRIVAVVDGLVASGLALTDVVFFADGKQVCRVTQRPYECSWDAGAVVAEHAIRVVATLSDGRRLIDTVRTRDLPYTEAVDVDVLQVTAVVTDGNGRFVRDLPREAFTIWDDDRAQTITSFAADNVPLELVVAVDVSSSMAGAMAQVRDAARRFLEGIMPGDQVTLLSFNDNIFTLATRERNQAARARALSLMRPWGGTALYDAIIKAVTILGRQSGRRSIVMFSDGEDQSSLAPLSTAIEKVEGSDATIYAVGQGRAVRTRSLQQLLTRLASVSGGRAFFTDKPDELDTIFGQILEDLRNQYVLSYPAPANARDGAWHRIRVAVDGYTVRAREGYRLARR
jgi:Ca-activated chloride channel homolog